MDKSKVDRIKEVVAKLLGYSSVDDMYDYRLSGEQDQIRDRYIKEITLFSEDTTNTVDKLKAALLNPPKHKYWGAGEVDCPKDIKAGNGELHTLRCKLCGKDNPIEDFCTATLDL